MISGSHSQHAADPMAGVDEFYQWKHMMMVHAQHQSMFSRMSSWVQFVQWQLLYWVLFAAGISFLALVVLHVGTVNDIILHTHSMTRTADLAMLRTMDGMSESTPEQRAHALKTSMAVGSIVQDFNSMGIMQSVGTGLRSVGTNMAQGDYDEGINSAFGLLAATFMAFKNGDLSRFYGDAMDTRAMVNVTLERANSYTKRFIESNATLPEVLKEIDIPGAVTNISRVAGAAGDVLGHPGLISGLDVFQEASADMQKNGGGDILGANIVRMTESMATITEQAAENRTITDVKFLTATIDEMRLELQEMRYVITVLFESVRQFQPENKARNIFDDT